MPQNEQLPVPPTKPEVKLPEHIQGYVPMGQAAVQGEEQLFGHEIKADYHDQAALFADRYRDYPDPRYEGRLRRLGRKILGRESAGTEVAEWLRENNESNLQRVAAQHRKNAEGIRKYYYLDENLRDNSIKTVRETLHIFDTQKQIVEVDGVEFIPPERAELNEYLATKLPVTFQNAYKAWKEKRDAASSSANVSDHTAWLAHLPKKQLLNFLQWHNHRTDEINASEETKQRIGAEKVDYESRITAAVENGDLSERALEAIPKIEQTSVVVGDVFDTVLKGRQGYLDTETGAFVLEEGFSSDTFRHEMGHNVLGFLMNEYLNEAMTEHIQLSLKDGRFDSVHPASRGNKGAYIERRELLHNALTGGKNPNLLSLAVDAYLEGDLSGPAHGSFKNALNESFEIENVEAFIFDQINESINESLLLQPHLTERQRKNNAIAHAADNLLILGGLRKGMSREEIIAPWLAEVEGYNVSPELKAQLRETLVAGMGIDSRIQKIRSFIKKEDRKKTDT